MKKSALISVIFIAISGCGSEADANTDADKVKNATLEFNKSITVGQALDNWKSCEAKKWEEFSEDNGIKIVQFTCQHRIKEFVEKVKNLSANEMNKGAIYFDVVSYSDKFQFTINKDGTFKISSVFTETQWSDGDKLKTELNPLAEFQVAYSNKILIDPNDLIGGNGRIYFRGKPGEKYKK